MSLALPTVLLALAIMPGILYRFFYHHAPAPHSPYSELIPQNITAAVTHGILFSVPAHVITLIFLSHWGDINGHLGIYFAAISGQRASPAFTSGLYYERWAEILVYLWTAMGLAAVSGYLVGVLVFKVLHLDRRINFLKIPNKWYYRFAVGMKAMARIDALTQVGAETVLYQGVLHTFTVDRQGQLLELVLRGAKRRKFSDHSKKFSHIEGSKVVVKYADVLNLNISFLPFALAAAPATAKPKA